MEKDNALSRLGLPMNDPRAKLLAAKIKKEQFKHHALIEVLHAAQNAYGYLPMPVLKAIAKAMHIPPARVFSTVTFYHFFSLKGKGDHTCLVCTGTACYVKGAQLILDEIEQTFGLKAGQVATDEKLGIQVARCIGACGLAPAVVIDDEVQARMDANAIIQKIQEKILAI